jgi:hypothetical protein
MEKTKTVRVRNFPESLHTDFKSYCVKERISMENKIIELIQNWVLEQESYLLKGMGEK